MIEPTWSFYQEEPVVHFPRPHLSNLTFFEKEKPPPPLFPLFQNNQIPPQVSQ